jgi:hypothetical protein
LIWEKNYRTHVYDVSDIVPTVGVILIVVVVVAVLPLTLVVRAVVIVTVAVTLGRNHIYKKNMNYDMFNVF